MKKRKQSVIVLSVALCCVMFVGLSSCTPAYSYGVTVVGVATNGVSEIALKSVDYRFYVKDYPDYQDFKDTESTVSVEYTFFNPSVRDVRMDLYSIADKPEYKHEKIIEIAENYRFTTDAEHTVKLRCVYNAYYNTPDAEKFSKQLFDERLSDDYYNGNLAVYKYTVAISELPELAHSVRFDIGEIYDDVKLFCNENHSIKEEPFDINDYRYVEIKDKQDVVIYSIEKEIEDIDNKVAVCDKSRKVIDDYNKISVTGETLSFDELLMSYYDENSGLHETDWYNAALAYVTNRGLNYLSDISFFNLADEFTYGYECGLTVPAQTEVKYTVFMPLYPSVNWGRPEYVYDYNLSVAELSNWQGTPTVHASIVTTGYQVEDSYYAELTQTNTGFEIDKIDLSKPTVSFALSEHPVSNNNGSDVLNRLLITFIVVAAIIALIPIVTVWTVIGVDRSKRKKAQKAQKESTATEEQNVEL